MYRRLTDDRPELAVRFLTGVHGVRDVEDAMSRDVLAQLAAAGVGPASATFDGVGLPTLRAAPDAR